MRRGSHNAGGATTAGARWPALGRVLALVVFALSTVFVWRSFYRMQIEIEGLP